MSAPVFDAAEEQRGSVGQQGGAGIENGVDPIWPVGLAEKGIMGVTREKRGVSFNH
jgi:hypothetical protein